jgi:hypothetical protein
MQTSRALISWTVASQLFLRTIRILWALQFTFCTILTNLQANAKKLWSLTEQLIGETFEFSAVMNTCMRIRRSKQYILTLRR